MKINKTFENAALRTINAGYVELDYKGQTQCFYNASVVSVNDGNITIEFDWKPQKGELIKAIGCHIDCYVIFSYQSAELLYTYGSVNEKLTSIGYFCLKSVSWMYDHNVQLFPVTPEEQQAFDDFCRSQGKIWNKEKLQWEKYKWKPNHNEKYYYLSSLGEVKWTINNVLSVDSPRIKYGNCFPTKEQAQIAAEEIKKLLNSL